MCGHPVPEPDQQRQQERQQHKAAQEHDDIDGRVAVEDRDRVSDLAAERDVDQLCDRGGRHGSRQADRGGEERADDGLDYSGKVFISNSACEEDAKQVSDLIEEKFMKMKGMVRHFPIGATIGSHTGPGTVALFFWGKERLD